MIQLVVMLAWRQVQYNFYWQGARYKSINAGMAPGIMTMSLARRQVQKYQCWQEARYNSTGSMQDVTLEGFQGHTTQNVDKHISVVRGQQRRTMSPIRERAKGKYEAKRF